MLGIKVEYDFTESEILIHIKAAMSKEALIMNQSIWHFQRREWMRYTKSKLTYGELPILHIK